MTRNYTAVASRSKLFRLLRTAFPGFDAAGQFAGRLVSAEGPQPVQREAAAVGLDPDGASGEAHRERGPRGP